MFSVANGYDASTNSGDYDKRFERRFLKAQQDRNQELLDTALKLLRQERIFTGNPKAMGDDIPFTVVAGNAARLWQPDSGGANQSTSGLLNCTQKRHVFYRVTARDRFRLSARFGPVREMMRTG
jgi:hypothetical protein